MLIISRKRDEKIMIADEIEITILEVGRNRVRLGVKAPKHIPIQTKLKALSTMESSFQPVDEEETESADQLMPAAVGFSPRS
jgi:carbon storage regulator